MSNTCIVPQTTLKEALRTARSLYFSGRPCSVAILAAIGEAWAHDYDPKILKMATPFGGGVADQADLCGCISGGVMALGLIHGERENRTTIQHCMDLTRDFHERFRTELGSTSCHHFSQGNFNALTHARCYRLVSKSVKILWDILERDAEERADGGAACEPATA